MKGILISSRKHESPELKCLVDVLIQFYRVRFFSGFSVLLGLCLF